ncbi:MAG: helix-turn-helix transcriptional regulator [Pseudomonadota bacterium]
MQFWDLRPAAGAAPARSDAALAGLIAQLARPAFAQRALHSLQQALPAGSWSVYQVWPARPPQLHLSASRMAVDSTGDCFRTYRDAGLYQRDLSLEPVRRAAGPHGPVMLRMGADDVPSAHHREAIYRRHGLVERLSVACREDDGSVLAVNLYRHQGQGAFDAADLAAFGGLAPLLLPCVRRQLEWQGEAAAAEGPRQRLRQRCPALTGRELDVLERLLRGMTYEGIAADMGLGVGTVKTYRARAFARLGIHFRSELFAGLLPS